MRRASWRWQLGLAGPGAGVLAGGPGTSDSKLTHGPYRLQNILPLLGRGCRGPWP